MLLGRLVESVDSIGILRLFYRKVSLLATCRMTQRGQRRSVAMVAIDSSGEHTVGSQTHPFQTRV